MAPGWREEKSSGVETEDTRVAGKRESWVTWVPTVNLLPAADPLCRETGCQITVVVINKTKLKSGHGVTALINHP